MSTTFQSLQYRNVRLFFVGLLVSNVGTWVQLTAMGLLVYRLTGSSFEVGLATALQWLPMLLIGAWAGGFADRRRKYRLAIITQAALAAQAFLTAILDLTGAINMPIVYGLSLVLGVVNAIDNPARRGFVTELVAPSEVANVVSLNTAVMTGSRIFGPAITALLVGPLGTGWLFLVNAVSFAGIIGALLAIRTSELHPAPIAPRGGTPVRDGLRFVTGNRTLLAAFIVFTLVSTFGFNYNVALPKLSDERWGSDEYFGWILAVSSIGSVAGSLLTAGRKPVTMRWYAGMIALLGVSGVAMAWAPNAAMAMVLGVPLGLGGAGMVTAMNAISQTECPPEMRGRILALTAVAFLGSTPIGGPITGWVGDSIGPEWSLAYGSVITLVTLVGLVWWALGRYPDRSRLTAARTMIAPGTIGPTPGEHP
jgi:MFS family permease